LAISSDQFEGGALLGMLTVLPLRQIRSALARVELHRTDIGVVGRIDIVADGRAAVVRKLSGGRADVREVARRDRSVAADRGAIGRGDPSRRTAEVTS